MFATKLDFDSCEDLRFIASKVCPTGPLLQRHEGNLVVRIAERIPIFLHDQTVNMDVQVVLARVDAVEFDLSEL